MSKFSYKNSVCNVALGNFNIAYIVNGFPGDPINLLQFDNDFQCDTIIKQWIKVGFLLMSLNSQNYPRVKWDAGVRGTPKKAAERI